MRWFRSTCTGNRAVGSALCLIFDNPILHNCLVLEEALCYFSRDISQKHMNPPRLFIAGEEVSSVDAHTEAKKKRPGI